MKMVRKLVCCVPDCNNNSENNPDLAYHCMPRSDQLRKEWLASIGTPELFVKPYTALKALQVCSKHFTVNQYKFPGSKSLNHGAVPTILAPPLTLILPAKLSALIRETIHNAADTPATDLPGTSGFSRYEVLPGPSGDEISVLPESSGQSREHVAATVERGILSSLGTRRQVDLTPRKRKLYSQLKKSERLLTALKKRNTIKSLFGKNRELDVSGSSSIVSNIRKLERMPRLVQTFINCQLKNFDKEKKNRRYNNEEKALFLALMKYSPKGYKFLSQFLSVPSSKTLSRSLSNMILKPGINDVLFTYMNSVSQKMDPIDKYCILMFDEVSLSAGLAYNSAENIVDGVVDLGTRRIPKLADHALVFMVRGLHSKWKQAIAFYFVRSATKTYTLKSCIQQVVRAIHEKTELRVLASVSDHATNNRAAVRSLSEDYAKAGGHGEYVYSIDNNKIFHIFDVPHFVKCLRNHFIDKDIMYDDKRAKWTDITQLYNFDGTTADVKVTKLSSSHIAPSGKEKMAVKFAAQVFSRSTYGHLTLLTNAGAMKARDTAEFILFINDLFDSLNCVEKSTRPLAAKLTDNSPHLEFWVRAKQFISQLKFVEGKNVVTCPPSIMHVTHTIRNIRSLWNSLKDLGFGYLLTKNLNQDPLENFFEIIRGLCGQNTNPTCSQFVSAFKTCVINNSLKSTKGANCEDDGCQFLFAINHFLSAIPSSDFTNRISPTDPSPHTPSPLSSQSSDDSGTDVSKLLQVTSMTKLATNITQKLSAIDCVVCRRFLFVDANNIAKIPTTVFINEIKKLNRQMFKRLKKNICKTSSSLKNNLDIDLPDCHKHVFAPIIIENVFIISINRFIYIVNRKLKSLDYKKNSIVDQFIQNATI